MAFLGRARGHSVSEEASPGWGKPRLSVLSMLTLVEEVPLGTSPTRAPESLAAHSPRKNFWPGRTARFPALSWLPCGLHTCGLVAPSFLPQTQD